LASPAHLAEQRGGLDAFLLKPPLRRARTHAELLADLFDATAPARQQQLNSPAHVGCRGSLLAMRTLVENSLASGPD
jgi:hypothetical protein